MSGSRRRKPIPFLLAFFSALLAVGGCTVKLRSRAAHTLGHAPFRIGTFSGSAMASELRAARAAGFDVVVTPVASADFSAECRRKLKDAEGAGIRVVFQAPELASALTREAKLRIVERWRGCIERSPAFLGFSLLDEAGPAEELQGSVTIQYGAKGAWPAPADYDGDGRADLAVFDPGERVFRVRKSTFGEWKETLAPGAVAVRAEPVRGAASIAWTEGAGKSRAMTLSLLGDRMPAARAHRPLEPAAPAPEISFRGDFLGTGSVQNAVWNGSTGNWRIGDSSPIPFGTRGDLPVPADYDGDGRMDIAVFRPGTAVWYIRPSSGTYREHGLTAARVTEGAELVRKEFPGAIVHMSVAAAGSAESWSSWAAGASVVSSRAFPEGADWAVVGARTGWTREIEPAATVWMILKASGDPDELRKMSELAVAHGAEGILWHGPWHEGSAELAQVNSGLRERFGSPAGASP